MKSSSKILPPNKSKPSIINALNPDSKKKATMLPTSDKRITKILKKNLAKNNLEEKNIAEADLNDEDIDDLNEANLNPNKPNDQLKLTDKELNEDMPSKMLVPVNPACPKNITTYSFKERKFVTDELVDQLVVHFSWEGDIIHKEHNEAKTQEEIQETRAALIKEATRMQEAEDPGAPKEDTEAIKKTLRNKFNYNEREAQTMTSIIREKGVSTEPPPSDKFEYEITQWEIFDTYVAEMTKGLEKNANVVKAENKQETSLYSTTFKRCLKIMERMVVQNDQKDKYHDYKYYWTQGEKGDSMKTEGHILPIWRFSNNQQKKKNVTSLCWNPRYSDLFAVGLGSYEFLRQKTGLICLFSIKNTLHPEYSFTTEAGVMCLDFHPKSPALLAVGLYDGTVLVYDIRNKHKRPIYQSTVRTNKHTDPVWQVYWNPDTSKNYNFYSISSDGRVMNWILMKNKLEPEEVIKLKLTGKNTDEETTLIGLAGGLCFDFNKFEPNIFIVGTEEGRIHKCSRAYSGQYQETYKGHLLAVYKVKWNNFHSKTFISASADWTVKIWDSKTPSPIMSFDLGTSVVDAIWAPYSSTVFATATLEKVFVYDLNIDKYTKLSELKPSRSAKLTNLSFNNNEPILLCGDTHGGVNLMTLSPNLTRGGKLPPGVEGITVEQYEFDKMENLIKVVGKFEKEDSKIAN